MSTATLRALPAIPSQLPDEDMSYMQAIACDLLEGAWYMKPTPLRDWLVDVSLRLMDATESLEDEDAKLERTNARAWARDIRAGLAPEG
jgi:hypothetical protein